MKVTWKRVVSGILISGIFIYLSLRGVSWKDVLKGFMGLNPWWFLLTVLFTFIAMFLRGIRWHSLLMPLKNISSIYLFSAELAGYMVNYLLPGKLGEIAKSVMVGKEKGISTGGVFATVILERVLDLVVILLIGLLLPSSLKEGLPVVRKISAISGLLLFFVILGIIVLFLSRNLLERSDKKGHKFFKFLLLFTKGLESIRSLKRLSLSFFVSILVWFVTAIQLLVLMPGMGIKPVFSHAVFTMFLFTLGITIPSSPGDIGPFHYFITLALVSMGVEKSIAFTYAVVYHFSQFITVVPAGIIIVAKRGFFWKEVS